jgi:hypothetical protein
MCMKRLRKTLCMQILEQVYTTKNITSELFSYLTNSAGLRLLKYMQQKMLITVPSELIPTCLYVHNILYLFGLANFAIVGMGNAMMYCVYIEDEIL